MAVTAPTQIRIEENTKKEAVELLEGLGLNLSDAVNIFLKQVILRKGIPFEVKYPEDMREFKPEVIEAMEESKRISHDPNVKSYTNVREILNGQYKGYRECHIQPDWLLIYLVKNDILTLTLVDTGTHSDLFHE
ncbi:MAG: type II toxin-antitoxin system RelB/DinJ family antitoxin [Lachnospiraceae bacterium]|nr:type II toxin-antitoxin system RelB/DinJ family antitoxin [Lachnospiraceae bacterium]